MKPNLRNKFRLSKHNTIHYTKTQKMNRKTPRLRQNNSSQKTLIAVVGLDKLLNTELTGNEWHNFTKKIRKRPHELIAYSKIGISNSAYPIKQQLLKMVDKPERLHGVVIFISNDMINNYQPQMNAMDEEDKLKFKDYKVDNKGLCDLDDNFASKFYHLIQSFYKIMHFGGQVIAFDSFTSSQYAIMAAIAVNFQFNLVVDSAFPYINFAEDDEDEEEEKIAKKLDKKGALISGAIARTISGCRHGSSKQVSTDMGFM